MKLAHHTCISYIHFGHQSQNKAEILCQLTVEITGMISVNDFHFFYQSC